MAHKCIAPNGKLYSSEAQMAKAYGVLPATFNRRKQNGLPLTICLKSFQRTTKSKMQFIYQGKTYHSIRDCCIKLNISYKTIYYFISRYNLTPKSAIQKYLTRNNEK